MTPLHDLLDEAAGRALAAVPTPDPQAALALARRDRLSRTRFRLAGLVAAAALVVLAASTLLATPGLLHRAAPASGPTGVPERWWTPPEWTPSVVDRPIASAGPLLDTALVAADQDGSSGSVLFARGLVVVSADGTTYRRVPAPDGSAAVLSPSGRRIAWVEGTPGGPSRLVLLDLATGGRATAALPPGAHPEVAAMSWLPADAGVVVSSPVDGRQSTTGVWQVDPDGRLTTVCTCGADVTAVAHPSGGPVLVAPAAEGVWTPVGGPDLASLTETQRAAARQVSIVLARVGPMTSAFAPDGTRVAAAPGAATDDPVDDDTLLVADRRGPVVSVRLAGYSGLRVLGWTSRGVLLTGTPPDGPQGLWLVDPDGPGTPVRVSTGDGLGGFGPARVVGVAADVAASGRTVPGAEPDRSRRSLAYVEYRYRVSALHDALTGDPQRWIMLTCVVLAVAVLAGPPLLDRRRRRLREPTAG